MTLLSVVGTFYQGVHLSVESHPLGVKQLILKRSAKQNALHQELIVELGDALKRLQGITDPNELRLLLVSGEGRNFCAGADLEYMKAQAGQSFAENLADARTLGQVFYRLALLACPTVALVQGAAYGGGVGLLACCDYVVAHRDAQFALSEVRLGLVPGVISPYVLRRIGTAHSWYMLSGERFSVSEAQRIGLVDSLADDLLSARSEAIAKFLQAGPAAARRAKELVKRVRPLPDAALFEYAAQAIADARASVEGRTGIQAFLARTSPEWASQIDTHYPRKGSQ